MSFYDRALQPGGSSYFSEPSATLDPNLFMGDRLHNDVRVWLLHTLEAGLRRYLDMRGAREWLHAWLAGSGITYQWAADRGNGDLDVLFGVDMPAFVHYNPDYHGVPERDVADYADAVLKQKLWPQTAHQRFGQQEYEVTFFWAPGTGQGIEHIHPYAAYDLVGGAWVVTPPDLPHDPRALYPPEWFQAAGRDVDTARQLSSSHRSLTQQLASTNLGETARRNREAKMARVRQSAQSLFDDIHGGRREAFGEQGRGYSDWANFRWQFSKEKGVITSLRDIVKSARASSDANDTELYGGPIDGPQTILTRDILRYGAGR